MGHDCVGKKSEHVSCHPKIFHDPYSHKPHQGCGKGNPHTQNHQHKNRCQTDQTHYEWIHYASSVLVQVPHLNASYGLSYMLNDLD
jgi:hypothetical protein